MHLVEQTHIAIAGSNHQGMFCSFTDFSVVLVYTDDRFTPERGKLRRRDHSALIFVLGGSFKTWNDKIAKVTGYKFVQLSRDCVPCFYQLSVFTLITGNILNFAVHAIILVIYMNCRRIFYLRTH